jgi:hypothetical protein
MKIIISIVIIFNLQVLSQVSNNKFTFTTSVGGGFASEAAFTVYDFGNRRTEILDYSPDLSGKLGIAYESLANLYDLNLGLAIEVGYFSASTSKYDFQLQDNIIESIVVQRIIPVTLSLLLDNDEILSPIIKIGLGLGNKKFTEEYENFSEANVTAENWFFILIGGTGLSYKINSSFKLALILEATILNGNVSGENRLGFKNGLQGIQTNTYFGLQFSYSINI